MSSKSTNLLRGVFSAFCFWIVVFSLCVGLLLGILIAADNGGAVFDSLSRASEEYSTILRGDLRETRVYKGNVSYFFERLYYAAYSSLPSADDVTDGIPEEDSGAAEADWDVIPEQDAIEEWTAFGEEAVYYNEADFPASYLLGIAVDSDILYKAVYRRNGTEQTLLTNAESWNGRRIPENFNFLFVFEGGTLQVWHTDDHAESSAIEATPDSMQEHGVNIVNGAMTYDSSVLGSFYTQSIAYQLQAIQQLPIDGSIDVYFTVRGRSAVPGSNSEIIGQTERYAERMRLELIVGWTIVGVFLLLLVFSILFRRDRNEFEAVLARVFSHIWIEVKLFVSAAWALISIVAIDETGNVEAALLAFFALFLLLYFVIIDLVRNRRIWQCNIANTVITAIVSRRRKKGFAALVQRKYVVMVGLLIAEAGVGLLFAVIFDRFSPILMLTILFSFFVSVVGTLVWFAVNLRDDLNDNEILLDQVERMYRGDLNAVNRLPVTSPLYDTAMQLNMIRDGIRIAVEQGVQSERTKVELITNVSHDIKTPLTSIITYVDLLKEESDLSEQSREYVEIIEQKADRLNHMVQDVFDLSKAATGNLPLELERLALDKLLKQTLAEMEPITAESRLTWRVQIPEMSCMVVADGQKLYRVFQNIIKNAAQYALEGSRVYLSLFIQKGYATVLVQNVTKHEIEIDGERLTARFVRGDDSRSTSGSGLGLSIARSFIEAFGGTCRVYVQGDLFTAEISLPLAPEEEVAAEPQIQLEIAPPEGPESV